MDLIKIASLVNLVWNDLLFYGRWILLFIQSNRLNGDKYDLNTKFVTLSLVVGCMSIENGNLSLITRELFK